MVINHDWFFVTFRHELKINWCLTVRIKSLLRCCDALSF